MEGTVVPIKCSKCGKEINGKYDGQFYSIQVYYKESNLPLCAECFEVSNYVAFPGQINFDWIGKNSCCYRCGNYYICHPMFGTEVKPEGVKNTEVKVRIGWRNKETSYEWKDDSEIIIKGELKEVEEILEHLKTMKPKKVLEVIYPDDWVWTVA